MSSLPRDLQCPHCDSSLVQPLAPQHAESSSLVTWYECLTCLEIWQLPKKDIVWAHGSPERRQVARRSTDTSTCAGCLRPTRVRTVKIGDTALISVRCGTCGREWTVEPTARRRTSSRPS